MKEQITKQEFINWADNYLRKELTEEESVEFEQFCQNHPSYLSFFEEHKTFLSLFKDTEDRKQFLHYLSDAENKYFENVQNKKRKTPIIRLWDSFTKYKVNIAIAVLIALVSAISTLWLSGFYSAIKKSTSDYSALRRDMNTVKKNVNAQNIAINSINKDSKDDEDKHYGATGFLLSNEGYAITNFHVISGADSIWLYNHNNQMFQANVVHSDTAKDIAILHIDDKEFQKSKPVPYTFSSENTELGEDIYTIGYPKDEAVYGQGYLSSATGYEGDTISYQISIPVNPGNSGGPVLDGRGNIIGMISGKQTGLEGSAFAIKTKALVATLEDIPEEKTTGKIELNRHNTLLDLSKTERIKELQKYIYMVKVQ